jgi:hypothetical protein
MKEYYVDFSCWIVRAESGIEAEQIALEHIKKKNNVSCYM